MGDASNSRKAVLEGLRAIPVDLYCQQVMLRQSSATIPIEFVLFAKNTKATFVQTVGCHVFAIAPAAWFGNLMKTKCLWHELET